MVPFFFITILLPEIIPVLILRGSALIPSTCITPEQLAKKRLKAAETRGTIAKALNFTNGKPFWKDIDGLDWKQAKLMCRYYGLPTLRPSFILRKQLRSHKQFLRKDNELLMDGNLLDSLSDNEIDDALEQRGLSSTADYLSNRSDKIVLLKQHLTSESSKPG